MSYYFCEVGPPGVSIGFRDDSKEPGSAARKDIIQEFRQVLEDDDHDGKLMLTIVKNEPPVSVQVFTPGKGAVIAAWFDGVFPSAITIFFSGTDKASEAIAIEDLQNVLLKANEDIRAHLLGLLPEIRSDLRRPIGTTIHSDQRSCDDQAVRFAASLLGEAFFGMSRSE